MCLPTWHDTCIHWITSDIPEDAGEDIVWQNFRDMKQIKDLKEIFKKNPTKQKQISKKYLKVLLSNSGDQCHMLLVHDALIQDLKQKWDTELIPCIF